MYANLQNDDVCSTANRNNNFHATLWTNITVLSWYNMVAYPVSTSLHVLMSYSSETYDNYL